MRPADLVFTGGQLLTQDASRPLATALAVADRRIVAVGSESDIAGLAGPGTRRVDLGGQTMIPGFVDAHAHIWKIGHLHTTMVDLRRTTSLDELGLTLQAAAATRTPDAWLQGRGYNEAKLAEGRKPDRADLDRMVPGRPVVITRTCGHIYSVNSIALARAGITAETPDPPGGVIDRDPVGRPTGVLHETAMGLVNTAMPASSRDDYAAMIVSGLRHQLSLGVTSSNDAGVTPELLEVYRWLDRDGKLPARIDVMALRKVDGVGVVPLPARYRSEFLQIETAKFLADGGLSGATAALAVPYRHAPTQGVLRFEDAELYALAKEATDAGFRLAIHAIGDRTIDQVLTLYERFGGTLVDPRIEHLGLPDAGQLARAARLGVIAVPQAVFLPALGTNFRAYLPDGYLERTYPLRSMLDAGLVVALSSDAPVVEDDNPLLGIRAAVDRQDTAGEPIAPDEAISAAAALWCYTMGGALAGGTAADRGSLTPGKWADLVILDQNPTAVPTKLLTDLRVRQTYLAGALVYEATR